MVQQQPARPSLSDPASRKQFEQQLQKITNSSALSKAAADGDEGAASKALDQMASQADQLRRQYGASKGELAVMIARGEVGVTEDNGSNESKRVREYRAATDGALNTPGFWCNYFSSFVEKLAGSPNGDNGAGSGYVPNTASWAKENGRWLDGSKTPSPGDQVIYNGEGHIGIVESVGKDGTIHTIEGNESDQVKRMDRDPSEIEGYVTTDGARSKSGSVPGGSDSTGSSADASGGGPSASAGAASASSGSSSSGGSSSSSSGSGSSSTGSSSGSSSAGGSGSGSGESGSGSNGNGSGSGSGSSTSIPSPVASPAAAAPSAPNTAPYVSPTDAMSTAIGTLPQVQTFNSNLPSANTSSLGGPQPSGQIAPSGVDPFTGMPLFVDASGTLWTYAVDPTTGAMTLQPATDSGAGAGSGVSLLADPSLQMTDSSLGLTDMSMDPMLATGDALGGAVTVMDGSQDMSVQTVDPSVTVSTVDMGGAPIADATMAPGVDAGVTVADAGATTATDGAQLVAGGDVAATADVAQMPVDGTIAA